MLRTSAIVLALAVAASFAGVQPAPAQEQPAGDGLSRLWRTYPLEQTTTVEGGGSSPEGRSSPIQPPPPPEKASPTSAFDSAGLVLALTLVVLGLAGGALRLVRRGRIRLNRPYP